MDHLCLVHAVLASVRTANLGKWFPPWIVTHQTWGDALNPRISGVSPDVLLFSECGHPLVHHYRVFTKGILHVSQRGNYLHNLQNFITQSEAVDRWEQDRDTAQLSPGHRGSASRRSIRQRDSDDESPRCKVRRARSPLQMDIPAAPISSSSLICDCRPVILPVSIRLADLVGDDVAVSVGLPNVIAPPGEDDRRASSWTDFDEGFGAGSHVGILERHGSGCRR